VLNIPQKFTHKLYQSFISINLNLYTHQPLVSLIIQWLIFNFWYKARGEDLHRKRNWPFQGGRIDCGINDGEFRRRFRYHWKKEHNIFQMTKARMVVLKHRTAPEHYIKISATASYHRQRVTAQLAMLLFLFYNIQAA